MPCIHCGDICSCPSAQASAAVPRWLPLAEDGPLRPEQTHSQPRRAEAVSEPANAPDFSAVDFLAIDEDRLQTEEPAQEDSSAWREELANRLNRYQARRKPRPPRYPSLRLHFEDATSDRSLNISADPQAFPQAISISNQALALDPYTENSASVIETSNPDHYHETGKSFEAESRASGTYLPAPPALTGKLIEFPRSWTPPPAPLDQLAEPVMDRPRILEAPELLPPPPALGGITIEPVQQVADEKRPGIDIPLQTAPLGRRVFSAAIDGVIVLIACVLFGAIFSQMTPLRPARVQIIAIATGLFITFWAAYQYLLLVYSASTPGLRLAGLELCRFDGSPVPRRLRRWRVLASFLSAASLGMGYMWVFLDEDALCWHDRITHTHLAPKRQAKSRVAAQPKE